VPTCPQVGLLNDLFYSQRLHRKPVGDVTKPNCAHGSGVKRQFVYRLPTPASSPIDLGSDNPGGSTGGNDFSTFTTRTAARYAIGLFDVASGYTLNARHNIFTVDPTTEIADGSHDLTAGGSGKIHV
jgi:hypothetical protein